MPKQEGYVQIPVKELYHMALSSLIKASVPESEAKIISESLVEADQRGVYTHGCVCLPRYIGLIRTGAMRPKADYSTISQTDVIEVWDAKRSNGQVIGNWAMHSAIKIAKEHGIGLVAVKNSNHFGAGAYYAQLAQKQGLIGIAMSTGASTMAPWGGADRLIGNNPVAIAIPTKKHPPLVLDMAQSIVAFGRISNILKQGGKTLPSGWALDVNGLPTQEAKKAFTVLPMAEHKGFGTALIIDILSGILFGGATGERASDDQEGPSCLYAALDIVAFSKQEEFLEAIDQRIDELKQSRLAPGAKGIFMPGEIEYNNYLEAQESVWMMPEIIADLRTLA